MKHKDLRLVQDPATLNRERVWYDKGAPNFGEGPNF